MKSKPKHKLTNLYCSLLNILVEYNSLSNWSVSLLWLLFVVGLAIFWKGGHNLLSKIFCSFNFDSPLLFSLTLKFMLSENNISYYERAYRPQGERVLLMLLYNMNKIKLWAYGCRHEKGFLPCSAWKSGFKTLNLV